MTFETSVFWDALTSSTFLRGALITVLLAVLAHATAIVLGLPLALARESRYRIGRWASGVWVWFFRAVPTLLQLLIVWNALPQLFPALKEDWFTPFLAAYIALAVNESAYMAEITRGALKSVDPGQRLAARALGMPGWRIMRRIIIPQATRVAIPPTANEFITLLKLTSLASVISLEELLTTAQREIATTFAFAELYAAAAVYYLVIVSVFMLLQMRLERRYRWVSESGMKRRVAQRLSWRRRTEAMAE